MSLRSHSRLGEQETNEKDRASRSAKPGYLANRNRDLLEERLQGLSLGSDGDSASHGQSALSGAYQLVPSFTLEPRLDKQACIFQLCLQTW